MFTDTIVLLPKLIKYQLSLKNTFVNYFLSKYTFAIMEPYCIVFADTEPN